MYLASSPPSPPCRRVRSSWLERKLPGAEPQQWPDSGHRGRRQADQPLGRGPAKRTHGTPGVYLHVPFVVRSNLTTTIPYRCIVLLYCSTGCPVHCSIHGLSLISMDIQYACIVLYRTLPYMYMVVTLSTLSSPLCSDVHIPAHSSLMGLMVHAGMNHVWSTGQCAIVTALP